MIIRQNWIERLLASWQLAPIVWLTGVRRVGKTTLAQDVIRQNEATPVQFFNCDLPTVNRRVEDPERFLNSLEPGIVVFDEVHQLENPSQLLKIAADEFPALKILATGSSTLAATSKFRDSLTGRKRQVHLTPILFSELDAFSIRDLRKRLIRGGLPPALLAEKHDPSFYSEWLDSYFARDIQELFKIEKRSHFLRLLESILRLSGGATTVQTLATLTGLSRPTIMNYLDVLETTLTLKIVRPHFGSSVQELVKQPKLYGFDTGFICHTRGIDSLRDEDCGSLWEHIVLDMLSANFPLQEVRYWRDKKGQEIDFVLPAANGKVHAIECKWDSDAFDARNLKHFRELYPEGENLLIAPNAITGLVTRHAHGLGKEIEVKQCGLADLARVLSS